MFVYDHLLRPTMRQAAAGMMCVQTALVDPFPFRLNETFSTPHINTMEII
jgi:hypothetical protein